MAQIYNLPDGYKNNTYKPVQFELKINNVLIDLTGYLIRAMFRLETKTGTVVKDISVGSGITITDAANGVFRIDSFVINFDANDYFYDIEMTAPNTEVETYVCGQLKVIQDVTYE